MPQCEICGTDVVQGRGPARRTCSAACRQRAHRRREAARLAELQAALTRPGGPTVPAPDGSPAGRIRAAGAELAAAIEHAAGRAADGWPGGGAEAAADTVQRLAVRVAAAIIAAAPPPTPRGEPAPARVPAAAAAPSGPSRDNPAPAPRARSRRRMTREQAETAAGTARLTLADRETSTYDLTADDGAVIGHVGPGYRAGRRSGWHGWAADMAAPIGPGPHRTRATAATAAAAQWVRLATARPRRTITGD